jgi:CBS domain-containing protein
MKVKEIMSPEIRGVRTNTTLQNAAEQMRVLDVGSLPVVSPDDNRVMGIVTDRDIVVRAVARGQDVSNEKVGDVMSSPLVCCHQDDQIEDAATAMKAKRVRRLLVLNEKNQPVGIVSLGDLAQVPIEHSELTSVMRYVSTPVSAEAH